MINLDHVHFQHKTVIYFVQTFGNIYTIVPFCKHALRVFHAIAWLNLLAHAQTNFPPVQQGVFALLVDWQRLVDNFLQGCWAQQTCYRLFQQLVIVLEFNNLSTSCEWQPCSNLITALLQLVAKLATSLLRTHFVDKLWDFYACSWL